MRSVFLFSAVVLAVNGCRPSEDKPAPAAPPAVNVKLAVAEVVETPALPPVSGVVLKVVQESEGAVVLLVATDDALTPGKPVTVLWPAEPRRRVLVPASAIQRHGQIERVWAVDASGKLALRLVRVAGTEDSRIEVASGLRGGEQVVESPVDGLVEGAHANAR